MSLKLGSSNSPEVQADLEEMIKALEALIGRGELEWKGFILGDPRKMLTAHISTTIDGREVKIERRINVLAKSIEHYWLSFPSSLQGKGLSAVVMDFTRKQMERFGLTSVTLNANLDVGGYAWLRKGFMPDDPSYLIRQATSAARAYSGTSARYLVGEDAERYALSNKLLARTKGMQKKKLAEFFLSDEFREFKPLFLGRHWVGAADLTDAKVRARLFGDAPALKPAATSQVADATYHSVMLERLKAAEVRAYNEMVPLLEKQINELLDRLRGTTLSDMTRGQINAQLRLLRQSQQAVLTEANDKLERRLRLLSEYEAGFEATTLQRYLTESGSGVTLAVPTGPAAFALANSVPLSATGDLLLPWVSKMTSEEVDQINKVILRGYSEGWTNDQLTTMLRGTKALNYTDGLLPRMGKHNATIVRTAIQHVASTAREQVWRDNEDVIDRYRWVATLDSRTSPTCRTLDGQEFELGKGPRPPIHPNCRSTTIAVIKGLEGLLDNLQRASADGQVPANLTYYEWLKTQPAAFQEDVLGPSRYKMFKRDDMTADKFAKLQLNSAFQPLTLEEIAKRDRR